MTFARLIGIGYGIPLPLGFNNIGDISVDYLSPASQAAVIFFSSNGPLNYPGATIGPNAPTLWVSTNGTGSLYEIQFLATNIDLGPTVTAQVGGTSVTAADEPYTSPWLDMSLSRGITIFMGTSGTFGTVDGIVSIRRKTTLHTVSRPFHFYSFVP